MTEKAAVASAPASSSLNARASSPDVDDSYQAIRHKLAEKMAGEITLSDRPGEVIKKWRTCFEISQSCLAAYLKVSPSVISDYESGRRRCPGIFVVNKIVYALLNMDAGRGGAKTSSYESILEEGFSADAIYDIHEYLLPMSVGELIRLVKGEIVYTPSREHIKPLYGYTIVNSLKAILHLSGNEFLKLYGMSSERAMIFTGVSTGRSPLVAIRVTNLKPALIVIHGISASQVDRIAAKIAEIEHVPLITTVMPVADLVRVLQLHDARY
ncbi:MAG: helix-turn-helix domain-containing protein [Candidatus Methanoperedens sp.]|nr:helix-turn-helix domain-containing protein [Candidatus Methanoperedens sp.]